MFSETSRYQKKKKKKKKKIDAKNYLIFKYVVENTRLKKKNHAKFIQANQLFFFFQDKAARRDLNLYRKSMERVIVVYVYP